MNNEVSNPGLERDLGNTSSPEESDLLWRYLKAVPAFRALLRAVESRFYQSIELPEPVLDLGCGDGLFAELTFKDRVAAGIDPWWGPLRKAKRSEAYSLVGQGYGHALPFASGSFSSAISNSVLEHIPDLQPVLYEIHRVLRDDGRFVVTMPSHYFTSDLGGALAFEKLHLNSLADGYRRGFNRISRHAHVDPPESWAARFADAGFSISQWQYYFSTKALHALEIGHLQGIPSAITHALTGHWILAPWEGNLRMTEQWVRPFYEEEPPHPGTMLLFILKKSPERPITIALPKANPIQLPREHPGIAPFVPAAAALSADTADIADGSGDPLLFLPPPDSPDFSSPKPKSLSAVWHQALESVRRAPRKRWLLLVSLILTVLAGRVANSPSPANRSFVSFLFWLLAIMLAYYALLDNKKSSELKPLKIPWRSWELPAIAALFLFSLAIRLIDMTSHPFILSGSEASIGLDAWAVAKGNIQSPFATAWLTNPTMPLYLLAAPISLFGRSVMAIRIISPFIGAISVVMIYLFGRRLWGPLVGFIAALLLAGSHVHVHYSRIGLTNIWDPLLVTAALGLIYSAWQERSRTLWLLAGVATGLNAYLYTSSHLLPLILLGIFIYLLRDWRDLWSQRSGILPAGVMALVVSLPQLLYYRAYPAIFFDRMNSLGIIQSGWYLRESDLTGLSPYAVLLRQIWRGMLSLQVGQDNSTAYFAEAPILGFFPVVLFVVGIGVALWRFKQLRYAIPLIWVGVSLLFAGALMESPPQSHRLLIALPAVYLLITLAAIWLTFRVFQAAHISKKYVMPVVLAMVLFIVISNIFFYFGEYRNRSVYGDRNTEVASEVSHYLNDLEGQWLVYFYGAPSMFSSFPTFAYLIEGFGEELRMVDVEEPGSIPPAMPGTNVAYIFLPERFTELKQVQNQYQDGELKILSGYHANPLSYIYQVES